MPIVWNSEADAKLLSAIIKVYDVKVSGAKLTEVAAIMGQGCTAKALTHRISKIRALAKEGDTNGLQVTAARAPRTDAKAAPKKSGGGRKKKAATPEGSDGEDEEEDHEAPASTPRPKCSAKKRNYAKMAKGNSDSEEEKEVEGLDKKIKIEVGEDIGEGLRS